FASESDTDVLAGSPKLPGTMATPIPIVTVHGPEQLLRPARVPSWLVRQELTRPVELSIRVCIALASDMATTCSCGSPGFGRNARSFAIPSPFTSPATRGV